MSSKAFQLFFIAVAAAYSSTAAARTAAVPAAGAGAAAPTAAGEGEASSPSPVHVLQPLPPLPSLPPVDLSSEGVEALLSEMRAALTSPVVQEIGHPLTSLLTRLSELLRSVEGRTLPPKAEQEATKLTESLRSVFAQQSILREKLSALQLIAAENKQPDVEGMKSAAEKLLDQYAKLQTMGEETLAALRELLQAMFPILKSPESVAPPAEAQEGVLRAVRDMYPDVLN